MALIEKEIDKSQLRKALTSMRLGGGVESNAPAARLKLFFALTQIEARWRLNAGTTPLNLPIHNAILKGPKALRVACENEPARLINLCISEISNPGHTLVENTWTGLTPLQCCARLDLWREASVLMEFGADPNYFTAGVTAIGLASYTGSARTLCQMIGFGANATLYLLPEHAPQSLESHGSTLLHRVAGRAVPCNQAAIVRILAECTRCYPTPLPLTLTGQSPLDWAVEAGKFDAYKQIAGVAARHERKILDQVVKTPCVKPVRPPRI